MIPKNPEEESLYQEIKKLDEEIENLNNEKKELEKKIKELMFKENLEKGICYAKEIHQLIQKKNMIAVEIDFREKKKKRLLWY